VRGQIVRRTRPLFYIFFGLVNFWRDVFEFERVLGSFRFVGYRARPRNGEAMSRGTRNATTRAVFAGRLARA
jgi:hypothetical protein